MHCETLKIILKQIEIEMASDNGSNSRIIRTLNSISPAAG